VSVYAGGDIWAGFWWVGREYQWVFFDDDTSETYAQQVTNCPGCGTPLDRKNLRAASPFVR
jgi:ssDNA-binding Zn-finger/Zn-ribbon topoisomerase 1